MKNTRIINLSSLVLPLLFTFLFSGFLNGQSTSDYNSVEIGDQVWMRENLKVTHFRNGDPIPHASTPEEWNRAEIEGTPAWCYFNNDPSNGDVYGVLYNWHAVNDSRGLAPQGWKIPSNSDWERLINFLGGNSSAGGKLKSTGTIEQGNGLWHTPNREATDESGFSALPGGYRENCGTFRYLGYYGYYWASNEHLTRSAWGRLIDYSLGSITRVSFFKGDGFSVRCISE